MADIRLSYHDLAAVNPPLVYVSITPFGQIRPKARYAATDLTPMAASGPSAFTGDADRSAVRTSAAQAWLYAGAEAAIAGLIAGSPTSFAQGSISKIISPKEAFNHS